MGGWRRHNGPALALDHENVDTDQLIPARFMVTPRAEGYGHFLLNDLRYDEDDTPIANFPLNRHPEASILVSRRNFGSGSSREAAVYALVDFGIRVVVAPSFGDIFAANAVNNGLLPARVTSTALLLAALGPATLPGLADLETQTLGIGNITLPFEIDASWREKLIKGWDDIDLTQTHKTDVAAYRQRRTQAAPWAFTNETGGT